MRTTKGARFLFRDRYEKAMAFNTNTIIRCYREAKIRLIELGLFYRLPVDIRNEILLEETRRLLDKNANARII